MDKGQELDIKDSDSLDLEDILGRLTPKQVAFLRAYCLTCNVTASADAARITHTCHYTWLKKDPTYKIAYELAEPIAVAYLESKAVERATAGWEEPVFYQGQECGKITKFSDSLLQFLLKGRDKKYRDQQAIALSTPDGALKIDPGRDKLTDADIATLIPLLESAIKDSNG